MNKHQSNPATCAPSWVATLKEGAALVKQGLAKLEGGPLDFYMDRATGSVEYLLTRFCPFKIGDSVVLTTTPEINEHTRWGWLCAKHFLREGASGVIAAVDCDREGLIFDVLMDNQTWLQDGVEKPVDQPRLYRFREEFLSKHQPNQP